jgi:hypothetical protein
MKIYLIKGPSHKYLDYYESAIVIAKNKQDARTIHPNRDVTFVEGEWMRLNSKGYPFKDKDTGWVDANKINKLDITHIGQAVRGSKRGVVLASFLAG